MPTKSNCVNFRPSTRVALMRHWMLAAILLSAAAVVHAHGATVTNERGVCKALTLLRAGAAPSSVPCSSQLIVTKLARGTVKFSFMSKRPAQLFSVSFNGNRGAKRKFPGDKRIQPIDQIVILVLMGSHLKRGAAHGECTYDNPYTHPGNAYVRCRARTKKGLFIAEMTDISAKPPIVLGH